MAKIPNLKLTQSEVSQTLNLKDILGYSPDEDVKQAFGQVMIDKIISRTQDGSDVNGREFAKYSESYKNSSIFKAYGKTSDVNLELTGGMLSGLDIIKSTRNTITVGINDETAARAYGNITGMKGHPTLDGVTPKRNFFGLTAADIKEIRKAFKNESEG